MIDAIDPSMSDAALLAAYASGDRDAALRDIDAGAVAPDETGSARD